MKRPLPSLAIFALIATFTMQSNAFSAFMLDFGPTPVTNTSPSFDATVSPAHAASAIPTSEAIWNQIQLSDVSSGLVDSTGAALSGVSVNLGIETLASSGIISFGTNPTVQLTGSAGGIGGVYSGTRVARDGILSGTANFALGLRIDGLQVGTYTLYFAARNTNSAVTTGSMRVYTGAGSSSSTYTFSSGTNFADVTNSSTINATSFTVGQNYNTLSVTIAAGQSLYLAIDGTGTENRGFINSLQIVPEPSATILLALGGLVLCLRRKGNRGSKAF